jgi:predicted nucleic acid-binding protein
VDVTAALVRSAGDFAERFRLKGYDAVHLAAFAEVALDADDDVRLSSFDERLNRAARAVAKTIRRQRNPSVS